MAPPTGVMNEMGTILVSPYLKPTSAWVGLTHLFTTPIRNQIIEIKYKDNACSLRLAPMLLGLLSYNTLPAEISEPLDFSTA